MKIKWEKLSALLKKWLTIWQVSRYPDFNLTGCPKNYRDLYPNPRSQRKSIKPWKNQIDVVLVLHQSLIRLKNSDQTVFTTLAATPGWPLPGTPADPPTHPRQHVGKRVDAIHAIQAATTAGRGGSGGPSWPHGQVGKAHTPPTPTSTPAFSARPHGRSLR